MDVLSLNTKEGGKKANLTTDICHL